MSVWVARSSLLVLAFSLVTLFIGCSTRKTVEPEPEPTPAVTLADVETFNPDPYRVALPDSLTAPREPAINHELPSILLEDFPSGPDQMAGVAQRSGYRIQIFSGTAKANADEWRSKAINWWDRIYARVDSLQTMFGPDLPVYISYHQPYYRVRVGNFVSRSAAEDALTVVRRRFPDAWVVPSQVFVSRREVE